MSWSESSQFTSRLIHAGGLAARYSQFYVCPPLCDFTNCIYTLLCQCAVVSQVMFTPIEMSATPPPTRTHTHTLPRPHTHMHSLAPWSCLPSGALAPRIRLTSIHHTPSPLHCFQCKRTPTHTPVCTLWFCFSVSQWRAWRTNSELLHTVCKL